MKHLFTSLLERTPLNFITWGTFCLLLSVTTLVKAQQSTLPCNATASTPFENSAFSGLTQTNASTGLSNWDNPGRVVDGDLSNFAQATIRVTGSTSLTVSDNDTYDAGNFAGFLIRSNFINVSALGSITVRTYLGTTLQETSSSASLVGINSSLVSGAFEVGFYTTKPFDKIELSISSVLGLGSYDVFYAVMRGYCAGPALVCNTPTPLNAPTYPVVANPVNTGFSGLLNVGSVIDPDNAVSASTTDLAALAITASAGGTGSFAIKDQKSEYPAGTFAALDVEFNSLLTASVLSTATITLFNNGTAVQTGMTNALIVKATSTLLTGRSRQIVGIVSTAAFDEIQINFNQVAGVSFGAINIYGAVFQLNCAATIACNTSYSLTTPTFPVIINAERTGVSGIAGVGTTIQDANNVVSASTTDFARLTNTASVGTSTSISVLDPVDTFPVGTFAGFAIRRITGVVNANLFANLTVTTFLDGQQQESKSAGNLLDLSVSLFSSTDFVNVGFFTAKPFDEIILSVAPLVAADVSLLGGGVDVFSAFIDTRRSTGPGLICFVDAKPDFNVTNRNQPVSGNVSTNDAAPTGTTYGTPVSVTQPAGATPTLTLTSPGTYTFTSGTPGVYVYNVPVCAPNQVGTCPAQTLTITVLDPTVTTNPPVANTDIASTLSPNAVTINVRANDGPGNTDGTLGTPTIATPPTNGIATVDGSGNVVYTPNAGFVGTDVLTYQVCETPGNLCATATVSINVKPQGNANSTLAADDYIKTATGVAASGNVSTNDTDPEGNIQTVTAQNITVPNQGTFVLTSTGSYTFTPVANFTGPVDFTYTTCDNGNPSACANGTLHVLVGAGKPDLTPNIILPQANFTTSGPNSIRNFTVELYELRGQPTSSGNVVFTITAPFGYTLAYDNSRTTINISGGATNAPVSNTKWTVTANNGLQLQLTINAGEFLPANSTTALGFTITRTIANPGSSANITVGITDDAAQVYDSNPANNIYARVINALSN